MASNSNSDTESIISVQLDSPSDNELDLQNGNISDSSSTNDVTGLVQDLDNNSDIQLDDEQYSENEDPPAGPDGDYDLCVDLDNLGNDTRSSDDMYDILNKDPEWTQNFSDIHVNQFTGPVGNKFPQNFDTSTATPLNYFQLFFSDDVFQRICDNTNKFQRYRVQQKKITSPNYVEKFWQDTEIREMKAYFGIAVFFGILNVPRYRNVWSKDPFLGNQGVQRVFSLKRYSKLSEYLHVSDREAENHRGHPAYDKLGKIRWLYDHIVETFSKFKNPERVQVLDEQIMPFCGRISFVQYNVSDLDLHYDLDLYYDLYPLMNKHFTQHYYLTPY